MIAPISSAASRRPSDALAYHNLFSGVYRLPFGAVPTGQTVYLRVYVQPSLAPESVSLRVWADQAVSYLPMHRCGSLWEVAYPVPVTPQLVWYRFDIRLPDGSTAYCQPKDSPSEGIFCTECDDYASFQLTVFDRQLSVPDWVTDGVLYQIFPDRFYRSANGETQVTGRKLHSAWNEPVDYLPDPAKGYYAADDFFGGNLRGIEEKLPDLKKLGITVLYLNPIFQAYSNHRYDTGDYTRIDPLLGSNEDFRRLCASAKALGIRVICDGVYSHTGSDSIYFNREGTYPPNGACDSVDSPYYKWYRFETYPTKYKCWWNVWSLPDVDETEPSYLAFITGRDGIARQWLAAGASGWRLDVADELPDLFLEQFRQSVKAANPDAWIVGEVWEDASNKVSYGNLRQFLLGKQLDSVMNYPLRERILRLLRRETDASAFCQELALLASNYPSPSFFSCMNFLSTHDVCRITTLLGASEDPTALTREQQAHFALSSEARRQALALHKTAALLLFAWPGIPSIYYGDEMGLEGCMDPFNRATFPWDAVGHSDADSLQAFYSELATFRTKSDALRRGQLLLRSQDGLLMIRRQSTAETRWIVINPTDQPTPLPDFCIHPLIASCPCIHGTLPPSGGAIF